VEGVKTTIPLQRRILADPDFAAGKFDTALHRAFDCSLGEVDWMPLPFSHPLYADS